MKEIEDLRRLTVTGLRQKYHEVFGEEARSNHKEFLFRRVAWRIQARAYGDLSERARRRAKEIADDADLRVRAPRGFLDADPERVSHGKVRGDDSRLPPPGTLLTRQFQGKTIVVKVLPKGFDYEGRFYKSLSAIASEVTGTRWNGFLFFGLAVAKERGRA